MNKLPRVLREASVCLTGQFGSVFYDAPIHLILRTKR